MIITTITNNGHDASFFGQRNIDLSGESARKLSEQISAVNFRLRESTPPYAASWHVAGDPTLLIILKGCIRITLRNGQAQDFKAGDMFIAEDHLASNIGFDPAVHGHTADVIGHDKLQALHLKLERRA